MRNIRVMLPNRVFYHSSTAETWGVLKKELEANDVSFSNMAAVCGENKMTFNNPHIKLPVFDVDSDVDFTLIVVQVKSSKGGEISYKEARFQIRKLREESEEARHFFGNYTQLSTTRMNELLDEWFEKPDTSTDEDINEVNITDIYYDYREKTIRKEMDFKK